MTDYISQVELGKLYKDRRTGLEGHAVAVAFQPHGCVEICLEYMKDGEPKRIYMNELRLVTPNDAELTGDHVYTSELIQGHEYEDIETGIRGWCSIVEFHENMATRGILRKLESKKGDSVKYNSIDEFLLKDITAQAPEPVKDSSGKKSPVRTDITHFQR